jgi:hypothetical protein
MKGRTGAILGILLAAGGSARSSTAQMFPDEAAQQALLRARSLKCSFPWYASAEWTGDEPKVKSARQDEFGFHLDSIDHKKRAARLIGNAGSEDLVVLAGADSVSFVEQVPIGSVNLTTVYAWRDSSGAFKAVHSRHTAIGGPSPSQNYGHCRVWQ